MGAGLLSGRSILVVAGHGSAEIAAVVAAAGGRVLGPEADAHGALALAEAAEPDAVVLDLALADAAPVAEGLAARGIPVLALVEGALPRRLRLALPGLPVQRKPVNALRLVGALAALIAAPR